LRAGRLLVLLSLSLSRAAYLSRSLVQIFIGALTGAFAYAGVDAAFDVAALLQNRRQHLRSWRVYTLGAVLGGCVAGPSLGISILGQSETIIKNFTLMNMPSIIALMDAALTPISSVRYFQNGAQLISAMSMVRFACFMMNPYLA